MRNGAAVRCRGALIGLAAGDRIGGPIEQLGGRDDLVLVRIIWFEPLASGVGVAEADDRLGGSQITGGDQPGDPPLREPVLFLYPSTL